MMMKTAMMTRPEEEATVMAVVIQQSSSPQQYSLLPTKNIRKARVQQLLQSVLFVQQ